MNLRYISGIVLSMTFLVTTFSACTDLKENIYSEISEDSYQYSPGDATRQLGAAYANLKGWTDAGAGLGISIAQAISTDEAIFPANGSGWDDGGNFRRMHQHKWDATQAHVKRMWTLFYSGAILCTNVIAVIEKDGFPFAANENKDQLIAEARALRAFYYWYILDNFGDAPLVITPSSDLPGTTPRKEIFNFVVKELNEVINILPTEKSGSNYGRFNRWAAKALLANVYLNAEVYTGKPEWEACSKEADDIIASGKYVLDPDYRGPFKTNNERSGENIFVIPFDEIFAQGFNYHLAALHGANQRTYNLQSSPWGAGAYKGTPQFVDTYDKDDDRLSATWLSGPQYAADGTPLLGSYDKMGQPLVFVNRMPDGIFTSEAEGLRYLKYEVKNGARSSLSNDYVIFRYAQVLLMKAECLLRMGRNDEAAKLVTQVRQRAFKNTPEKAVVTGQQLLGPSQYKYGLVKNYILTPQTKAYPLQFGRLYDELGWELAGETFRRRDMIRFGHYTKAEWLSHQASEDFRAVYPIPQDVVNSNPNLHQNPNYK
ncbi:RagB/SusD family nutrient uptake outer membrane protein [Sphingobacterium sp.]|uniref:RagB/SusD family nutrient uptake outer membrane protein n=1 Tax=Sphingobacterium sp. TaxID=341027 RepID=UPI002FDDB5D6